MHELMPLALLSAGSTGVVGQLVGQTAQVQRLREMGLRDGERLEVLHAGRPCIVRVAGQRLCFRDNETMGVLVRIEDKALSAELSTSASVHARAS